MSAGRMAGVTFIAYVLTAIGDGVVYGHATAGTTVDARLAAIAHQSFLLEFSIVLGASTVLYALVLAVTLYSLTRGVDTNLALFAMSCRVLEASANMAPAAARIGLLRLATDASAGTAADRSLQASILFQMPSGVMAISSTMFAVGSATFAFLLLRGRLVASWLAVLGVVSSLIVVPVFLLRGMRLVSGSAVWYANLPLIAFELLLALWLLAKGIASTSTGARAQ